MSTSSTDRRQLAAHSNPTPTDRGAQAYADGGKGDLNQLMDSLDDKSRQILWHLWWHRHAHLDELADLIGASTDMEVLSRLREVINPAAERILGEPVLEFSESRIDPISGDKVLFSWWLVEEGQLLARGGEHLVDLFDEKDHIVIIAELPPSVRLCPEGLPKGAEVAYRNGILKIKLPKRPHL